MKAFIGWLAALAMAGAQAQTVAITLDDGPHTGSTPRMTAQQRNQALLDALARHHVQAALFVTSGNGANTPEGLALAREPEQYSKKFRYNQRREQRLLEEAGGVIRPMLELTAQEQARIYGDLFQRRWGFEATGKDHLAEVFGLLREFMTGSLIYLNDEPVAIQVLYRVEAPQWVSLEYINGGVDPQQREFSPGSVLSFVNTQHEWEQARALGKPLRYSFGRADREYKDRWCNRVPVYQV